MKSNDYNGQNRVRILVMDDDKQCLKLYRTAFSMNRRDGSKIENRREPVDAQDYLKLSEAFLLDVTYCDSCAETVACIANSIQQENPFAVAFLDIRMEGEKDGIWVGKQLRKLNPNIELVFVTGFSGYDPEEIAVTVPPIHKMIYVQKPFSIHEILHLAHALGHKWLNEKSDRSMKERLNCLVAEKTLELRQANEELEQKVQERTVHLEEVNTALKILLKRREEDKDRIGETVIENVEQLVRPMLEQLKMTNISARQEHILKTLEANLKEITTPFLKSMDAKFLRLTPMEIQVANYVKSGLSNKELAKLLGVSKGTIMIHRHNLRTKLGIKNKKINLRTALMS